MLAAISGTLLHWSLKEGAGFLAEKWKLAGKSGGGGGLTPVVIFRPAANGACRTLAWLGFVAFPSRLTRFLEIASQAAGERPALAWLGQSDVSNHA